MVAVYIHPRVDQVKARVLTGDQSISLKIEGVRGDITICGDKDSAPALQMIADIFNDAFVKVPEAPDLQDFF